MLADGTAAAPASLKLDDISGPAISTRLRVVPARAARVDSLASSCLRGPARGEEPRGSLVERIGVDGETVSLRSASGVLACDRTRAGGRGSGAWCGSSFGRLYAGRLRDPRLDIGGCRTRDGTPVAFAWIDPDPGARYVAVAGRGYAEVYETAASLPIRASTRDIHPDDTGATFDVTEHDGRGRLVRRFELDAMPAG